MKNKIVLLFAIFILAICAFVQSDVFAYKIIETEDGYVNVIPEGSKINLISSTGGRFEIQPYIQFGDDMYEVPIFGMEEFSSDLGYAVLELGETGNGAIINTYVESGYRLKSIKLSNSLGFVKEIIITEEEYKMGEYIGDDDLNVCRTLMVNSGRRCAEISQNMVESLCTKGTIGTISVEFVKLNDEEEEKETKYEYLNNENGTYTVGENKNYSVRIDADYSKFESVTVDNELVDSSNYTTQSGSTIVTFNEEYMNRLSEGEHTLSVNFTDGVANTKFTVAKASNPAKDDDPLEDNNPAEDDEQGENNDPVEDIPTVLPENTPTPETVVPTKKPENSNNDIPKTGDEIYIATVALILIVLGNVIYYKRKK